MELDRRRVSEAEGVAKRAEEELVVAKERLLLQEDELQSRAGTLDHSTPVLSSFWNVHFSGKSAEFMFFHYSFWLSIN